MAKVLITDYINDHNVESEILGDDVTLKVSEEVEVLLVWHEKITEEFLNQFPNIKGVVRYGVGFDAIDLDAIKRKGIFFCNTPDYGTDEVSDTAIGMLLNLTRGIHVYDFQCKDYNDDSWQENIIPSLRRSSDMVLGVIGAGRIGGSLIRKALAVGFNVIFYDPYKDRGYEKMLNCGRVDSLNDLINNSDIISVNTPLTSETRGLVDKNFIHSMKTGAYFMNTSRGEIVKDLDDFVLPLLNNSISGVAFDVLPDEPPKKSRLISLWRSNDKSISGKVIINPHTSYYSSQSFKEMRVKASLNAKRILEGKTPYNIIR